jgi:hypothetical protein
MQALAIALALAVSAGAPSTAQATTFVPLTTDNLADVSTAIVEGTVTSVRAELDDKDRVWTIATVEVARRIKGVGVADTIDVWSLGGAIGRYTTHVEGQAVFSEGEHLLVFLHRGESGRYVPVGKFLGKMTFRRAPDASREHLMRWHPRPEWSFDHRFLPHPPAERRIFADDFIQGIQEHLAQPWDGEAIPGVSADLLERVNTPENRSAR